MDSGLSISPSLPLCLSRCCAFCVNKDMFSMRQGVKDEKKKHNNRYIEFLGDRDSKAHDLLIQENVYGDVDISKLECVGHVQKCLGSRLRPLKKQQRTTQLADGKAIGRKGRLTDKRIDNGKFILARQSGKIHVTLIVFKMLSWPIGITQNQQMKIPIMISVLLVSNLEVASKGTFKALSGESLLSRCLHGGTQNQNEAINGLIWQRATKETHVSTPTVELVTFLAVGHFNDGSQTPSTILEAFGIDPGYHCRKPCKKLDHDRIRHSPRKSQESKKRSRQL